MSILSVTGRGGKNPSSITEAKLTVIVVAHLMLHTVSFTGLYKRHANMNQYGFIVHIIQKMCILQVLLFPIFIHCRIKTECVSQRCMLFLYCTYMHQFAVYIHPRIRLYEELAVRNFVIFMFLYHTYAMPNMLMNYTEKRYILKIKEC